MDFSMEDGYMPLDSMSEFFKDHPDLLSNPESQFQFSNDPLLNPVDDALDRGMQNSFDYSDETFLDHGSTILEDQIPETLPSLEAVSQAIPLTSASTFKHSEETDQADQDEYIRSVFSSAGGSKFPTTFNAMACLSPASPAEMKYMDDDGVEWDPRHNAQLDVDGDEIFRRRSIDTITGPAPSPSQGAIKNNRSKSTPHTDLIKPRRRRGRKPSNLSPEEKRRRRLERGRLAANKCRRKKRELENELETRAQGLLDQRNSMIQLSCQLREELQNLVQEAMDHGDPGCGGIPQIEALVAYFPTYTPPPTSQGAAADFDQATQNFYAHQARSPRLAPNAADQLTQLLLVTDQVNSSY